MKSNAVKFLNIGDSVKMLCGQAGFLLESGLECTADTLRKNPFLEMSLNILDLTGNSAELSLEVRNISSEDIVIKKLIPALIAEENGGNTFLNPQINSWTQLAGGLGPGVTDLCDPCHNSGMLDYRALHYALYGCRSTGRYLLFGFLSFADQDSTVLLHGINPGFRFRSVEAVCDAVLHPLKPGESLSSERILVRAGNDPDRIMKEYFSLIVDRFHTRREFRDIIGWSPWDYYLDLATEDDVMENLHWLEAHRDTIPVEYVQIDGGYTLTGDWLSTNSRFPHGLRWLSERIREAGFKAGLWICPFLASAKSEVARKHPEWLLKKASGAPVFMTDFDSGTCVLDCTVPEVTDYMRELARTVTGDFGFSYIKLDGANAEGLSPLAVPKDRTRTNASAMLAGLSAFRSGMAEGSFLLNASMFGLSLGLADAMRVGEDAGGRWDASRIAKHHGERDRFEGPGEVRRAIAAAENHYQQHKLLWINDPDYLVVRQEGCNSELTYPDARSWATTVALMNGLVMIADPMPKLAPGRLELLEKVLPHSPHAARPVDFFRKNVPSILAMDAESGDEHYVVASVVNTDIPERVRDYELNFRELGLKPDTDYLVFDFWNSAFAGCFRDSMTVRGLAPHDCRVFSFRAKTGGVQVICTDSHISMGAVELSGWSFDGKVLRIGTRRRGRPGRVFLYVPEGFSIPEGLAETADNHVFSAETAFDGEKIEYAFPHR